MFRFSPNKNITDFRQIIFRDESIDTKNRLNKNLLINSFATQLLL